MFHNNTRNKVKMSDANRAATATASPPAATRGLRSERAWNDVRSAARIAREEGVVLRLHGTLVMPLRKLQKQAKGLGKEQKKPAEAAAPPLLSAKVGEAPPSPALSKRQQRSAHNVSPTSGSWSGLRCSKIKRSFRFSRGGQRALSSVLTSSLLSTLRGLRSALTASIVRSIRRRSPGRTGTVLLV